MMLLSCSAMPWPPRVLIVEDESIIALATKANLKRMGCEVVATVATGQLAVEYAVCKQPDVVLMDIMLEGNMDGIQAAALIREKNPDLHIIYCTAYTDSATRTQAAQTNPKAFMAKPLDYGALKEIIDELQ
jgi:CheY-like chemotaxis protein